MNERGGDGGKGKEKKRDLFPPPIFSCTSRVLFFFSQLEPPAEERRAPN